MTEIKRYELVHLGGGEHLLMPAEDGDWIKYEDHAAIVAALNEKVQTLAAEVSECRRFVAEELGQESGVQFSGLNTERSDEVIRNIRAQGIHFAANRIIAAWETGFIDGTARQAYDISGAVLSAIEFLPGASDGEFSRDYADEVRARIRKGGIEL